MQLLGTFCQFSKVFISRSLYGIVTIDTREIQRIIRELYEKLHADKSDNLEEMGKFLEK